MTTGSPAFATTHWVIDWVHGYSHERGVEYLTSGSDQLYPCSTFM
jgi:hypothetical protein